MRQEARAFVFVIPTIILILVALFAAGNLVTRLLGLPAGLGEPLWLQLVGVPVVIGGLAQAGWFFRHRDFRDVLISTFVTFRKMTRGAPLQERLERTEPLVVDGPHKYVRHPLYFGVVVMTLGWAVFSNSTYILVSTALVFAFLRFVMAPFEEKELRAVFGSDYELYSRNVPSMIPFTKVGPGLRPVKSKDPR